ncbi:hypothetical protein FA95DRAFT_1562273 [Auriscalpium vulgare]|uniref:Uncharacterized protein n=1 Tax=Auriscalpium vulgare TaxID=40419 RepID=A0ACB8RJV5_9AGAM|nr:hypothetical protein FA95DRAFT_1562273 [Auriscalpium vulgare]
MSTDAPEDVIEYAVDAGNVRTIRLTNFDLAEHIAGAFAQANPFIPPVGTPVHNLPSELLAHIFTLGADAEEDDDDDEGDDEAGLGMMDMLQDEPDSEDGGDPRPQLPFQVLVSHVCRRWRDIALQTPTLWTSIDFSEGPPFEKSRAYIERSKECLLDIELDCTLPDETTIDDDDIAEEAFPEDEDADEELAAAAARPPRSGKPLDDKTVARAEGRVLLEDLPAVRDLIMPHLARWRIFELMVNDYTIMHSTLSTLARAGAAPHLEALQLYHYEDSEQYAAFAPPHLKAGLLPFGGRAPALTHVALWGVHLDWERCAFLEGLHDIELAYHAVDVRPSYAAFTRILAHSPRLETLTLCLSGPGGQPDEWPADVVELPSVVTLVLAFHELRYISELMKRLSFPGLKSLALDFDDEDFSSFLTQLAAPAPGRETSFLTGISVLKISGLHCTLSVLDRFYAALPNLTTLSLNCYHLDEVFFHNLFPAGHTLAPASKVPRPGGVWLPRLETLTTSGIDGAQMHELIVARRANPIKRVFMDMDDDVEDDDEAWLRANVEHFEYFEGSDDDDEGPDITEFDEDEE